MKTKTFSHEKRQTARLLESQSLCQWGQQPSLKLRSLLSVGGTQRTRAALVLPEGRAGRGLQAGKEVTLTRVERVLRSLTSATPGLGSLLSWLLLWPSFCPPAMKSSAGRWLQQLCTLNPWEPLSLDAQERGGIRTRPPLPPPPCSASSHQQSAGLD